MLRSLSVCLIVSVSTILLTGCLGTVIGTAADAVIEVGKVPFKVGGAVVDGVTNDDDKDTD